MIAFSEQNRSLVIGFPAPETAEAAGIVGTVYDMAIFSSYSPTTTLSNKLHYPYFSRTTISTQYQTTTILDFLVYYKGLYGIGWTDIAILSIVAPYTSDFSSDLILEAESEKYKNEINILEYQQYLDVYGDLTVELKEISNSKARVIIAAVFDDYSILLDKANEYELIGENYVWFVPPAAVGLAFLTPVPLAKGTLTSLNFFPPNAPNLNCFINAFKTANPKQYPFAGNGRIPPLGTYSAFDTVYGIALAIDQLDRLEMLDQYISAELWSSVIRNQTFEGLSGLVAFDENGDRIATTTIQYYDPNKNQFLLSATREPDGTINEISEIIWFSNSTEIPDLDIREPFDYWSCHNKEKRTDETGKTIQLHSPDGSDIDDIDYDYYCDSFIDCKNLSDESSDGCSSNYVILFIVFGIITGILMLLVLLLIPFVFIFGILFKYRRIKSASPIFLIILLISIFIGFASIFAFYGKPHPVACGFQPWLLGLSSISMITVLVVKNFRIWRIFRFPLKRTTISDLELFVYWFLIMLPALIILILWSIISTPTASLEDLDGNDHFVCTTGGFTGAPGGYVFFAIFASYSAFVLFVGTIISILSRNVPSMFNESKLLTISIYNLVFLSVLIIPLFLVLRESYPFWAWIFRTCAVLYAFTTTLLLQFVPKIFGIIILDKGKNTIINNQFISSTATGGSRFKSSGSMSDSDRM